MDVDNLEFDMMMSLSVLETNKGVSSSLAPEEVVVEDAEKSIRRFVFMEAFEAKVIVPMMPLETQHILKGVQVLLQEGGTISKKIYHEANDLLVDSKVYQESRECLQGMYVVFLVEHEQWLLTFFDTNIPPGVSSVSGNIGGRISHHIWLPS